MSDSSQISSELLQMLQFIEQHGHVALQEIIALSRWPNGVTLSAAESALAMQALLIHEHRHVPLAERTAFIHKGSCQS